MARQLRHVGTIPSHFAGDESSWRTERDPHDVNSNLSTRLLAFAVEIDSQSSYPQHSFSRSRNSPESTSDSRRDINITARPESQDGLARCDGRSIDIHSMKLRHSGATRAPCFRFASIRGPASARMLQNDIIRKSIVTCRVDFEEHPHDEHVMLRTTSVFAPICSIRIE